MVINPPVASPSSDALSLLTLLSDKDRAAQVLADYDKARVAAEAAINELVKQRAALDGFSKSIMTAEADVKKRSDAMTSDELELQRRRSSINAEVATVRADVAELKRKIEVEHQEFSTWRASTSETINARSKELDARAASLSSTDARLKSEAARIDAVKAELAVAREYVDRKMAIIRSIKE